MSDVNGFVWNRVYNLMVYLQPRMPLLIAYFLFCDYQFICLTSNYYCAICVLCVCVPISYGEDGGLSKTTRCLNKIYMVHLMFFTVVVCVECTRASIKARCVLVVVGIVIPGFGIPGLARPKSRDFGIEKNCIFQLKPAYIPWYLL